MISSSARGAMSEAVFGSAARGDSDSLSDRDYLIVDNDLEVLNRRGRELRSKGWSVASYTFAKLNHLAANGVLFIQHIKGESVILSDKDGQLEALLKGFCARSDYSDELDANARLAAIVSERPGTPEGALWAADVLYVTFRNFGVLTAAQTGNYVFAYSAVVEALIGTGVLNEQARSPLLKLRFLKSLYRSGEKFSSRQVEEALQSAIGHLPKPWFPAQSIPIEPREVLLSARRASQGASAYERLRGLEKCFIAADSVFPAFKASKEALRLRSWIENPRAYASLASSMEREHLTFLRGTLKRHQAKQIAL